VILIGYKKEELNTSHKQKNKMIKKQFSKKQFKDRLMEKTGCSIQHNGWSCGTCFFSISPFLTNEDWNSLLSYRGDYKLEEINKWRIKDNKKPLTKEEVEESLNKIWELIK